jgi:hypothetical protein
MHRESENLSTPYIAPRNDLERALAAIWQEGLGIVDIGIHDDFLELGGSSLLAIEMVAQIRRLLIVEFVVHDFLERPTIASQAEGIAQTLAALADERTRADLAATADSAGSR